MVDSNMPARQDPSTDAAFCLRALTGPLAGKTWRISDAATLLGRGVGCHIRVEDTHVSRTQCEITVAGGVLRLRNLSQRNPTLVNGVAREEADIAPGDLVEFAGVRFIVDYAAPAPEGEATGAMGTRTTQGFEDAPHLRELGPETHADERLTRELHGLFHLSRTLGRAAALDKLIEQLKAHLGEQLQAGRIWIGWRTFETDDLALFPPASPEETRRAPMELMAETCFIGNGILENHAAAQERNSLLAAPLLHGGRAYGALAVERPLGEQGFTHADLDYIVAVAECAAPLIRGAERLEQMQRDTQERFPASSNTHGMVGSGLAMQETLRDIRRAAVGRAHVLFLGETGVGKELAARMLHELSPRAGGPYVVLNCAATSRELFASELFGHERGAFTGAFQRRRGLFEQAHGGTLFLDEIGELSLEDQARLLRVVETGVLRRLGAEQEVRVDVRILCATNRELPDEDRSHFRSDLYHRLAGMVIRMKPLRERRDDIAELASYFLEQFSPNSPFHPKGFTQEALEKMLNYAWPGNIRELRNVVERACYISSAQYLQARDIQVGKVEMPVPNPVVSSLEDLERLYLNELLRRCGGSVKEAAKALGISRSTLYYKLNRHNLRPKDFGTAPGSC